MAAILLVSLAACNSQSSGAGKASLSAAAPPAPDFRLASLAGDTIQLGDFDGRVVVLELWATWCAPCRLQAEILHELYEEVDRDQVEFLAISLGEAAETVESFVEKEPFAYPVLLDPQETLGAALEIYALPTVVVVDGEGRIQFVQPGIADAGTLRRVLSDLGVGLTT